MFLSRVKNESVVRQQRYGIGDQFVQLRIAELQGRLWTPWRLLLTHDIGDVISTKGLRRRGLLNGSGDDVRAILANQFEQLRDLAGQRTVAVGHIAQIGFHQHTRAETVE